MIHLFFAKLLKTERKKCSWDAWILRIFRQIYIYQPANKPTNQPTNRPCAKHACVRLLWVANVDSVYLFGFWPTKLLPLCTFTYLHIHTHTHTYTYIVYNKTTTDNSKNCVIKHKNKKWKFKKKKKQKKLSIKQNRINISSCSYMGKSVQPFRL